MTATMIPGAVLGDRYRLEDLLEDVQGARFWRATDTVLTRDVAVHAIPESDPRTPGLLDAARRSATVTDPHLLRVLDADVRDGVAWVINEWGEGESLDALVASHRVLSADRAAWLVREVAAAIAVAHSHDLAHGRLAPENVMVTRSGTVRLIGFAIDAEIQRSMLRSNSYPGCTPRECDVIDLAGLLYTGLVGHWPGASGSHVRPAPRAGGGPLRPRQVRAGVPRPLDLICDRVLSRSHPGRTAHQLAAVLTEFIGELATTDPAVVPSRLPELDSSLDDLAAVTGSERADDDTDEGPLVRDEPGDVPSLVLAPDPLPPQPEVVAPSAPESELAVDDQPWEDETTHPSPVAPEPDDAETAVGMAGLADLTGLDGLDGEPTQQVRIDPLDAAAQDTEWHRRSTEPAPPAPDLDPVPERPLFAPEGTRRTPKGAAPRSATSSWGTTTSAVSEVDRDWAADTGVNQGAASWPFGSDPEEEPDDWEERTSRSWLRVPLVILVIALLAAAVAVGVGLHRSRASDSTPSDGATAGATRAPSPGAQLRIRAVQDLDPYADPPEEDPGEVDNVVDGDPRTTWQTQTYRGRADLGGLKPGVGLALDLGSIQRVGSVAVRFVGKPTDVVVYAAPTAASAPTGIEGLTRIAGREGAGTTVRLAVNRAVRTRYVVLWLTSLPPVSGGFRGEIAEVSVRS